MLGDSIVCSLCAYVHRAGFLEAGSPELFTALIISKSFLLFVQLFCFIHLIGCVFVIFNAVMSEGRRYLHALSFAHCVRADSVWSGSRAVQSPGSALTPCHIRSLWAAAGAVGLTSLLAFGLKCLQSGQCRFGKMSALEFERPRTDQRPGFWCDVVYSCALTDGVRTVAFFVEYHSVHVFGC